MNKKAIQNAAINSKYLIIYGLIILCSFLYADKKLDSLNALAHEYSGLPRIEAKLQIGYEYRRSDFELATSNINEAYEEALSLELVDMQAKALYYLGLTNHYFDYSDSALVLLQRSTELFRQEKDYKYLGKVLGTEGTVSLRLTGDQATAMARYNEALVYSRKASDNLNMAIIYSQLSNIFRLDGSFSQAIEFIFKSKEQYELAGEEEGVAWIAYSTGRIYSTMDLYEDARDSFNEAL